MTRTDDELERLLRETFADAERQVTEDHPLPATPGRPRQARWLVLAAAAAVAAVPIGVTAVRGLGESTGLGRTVGHGDVEPGEQPGHRGRADLRRGGQGDHQAGSP